MSKLLSTGWLLVLLLILPACTSLTTSLARMGIEFSIPFAGGVDASRRAVGASFCDVASPIYWSLRDTPGTTRQVKLHNEAGVTLCGWRGVPVRASDPVAE